MEDRSADWSQQARRDISGAKNAMESGFHEWACFIAQQGAEKAVVALYNKLKVAPYGHDVAELLRRLGTRIRVPDEVMTDARSLDRYYTLTRYPDSFATGTPENHFTRDDAEDALCRAERVLALCESILAG